MIKLNTLDNLQSFNNSDIKKYKNLAHRVFSLNSLLVSANQSHFLFNDLLQEPTLKSMKCLAMFNAFGEHHFEDSIYNGSRAYSHILDIDHQKIYSFAKYLNFISTRKQSSEYQSLVHLLSEDGFTSFINKLNIFVLYQKFKFSLFYLPVISSESEINFFSSFYHEIFPYLIDTPSTAFSLFKSEFNNTNDLNHNFDTLVNIFNDFDDKNIHEKISANQFNNSDFFSLTNYINQFFKSVFQKNSFLYKYEHLNSSSGKNFGFKIFPLLTTLASKPEERELLLPNYNEANIYYSAQYFDRSILALFHFIKYSLFDFFSIKDIDPSLSNEELQDIFTPQNIKCFSGLLQKFYNYHELSVKEVKANLIYNLSSTSFNSEADSILAVLNAHLKTSDIENNLKHLPINNLQSIKKKI